MPTSYQRQHRELPDYEALYEAALGFIADGGTYTPTEIRQTIAEVYEIPPEHLALRLDDGTPAFHNYVAHVLPGSHSTSIIPAVAPPRMPYIRSLRREWRLAEAPSKARCRLWCRTFGHNL